MIFKQKRIGRNGKIFTIYKFRTLKENKSIEKYNVVGGFDQELYNADFESRITKLGQFLRKTNLDEYPQFINVLFGSMSVVGPRPLLLSHTNDYKNKIDKFMVRHKVKPGITGLAQVSGYRGNIEKETDMQNRVKYDIFYIENWSLFLDIKIIIKTILNILQGEENAY